MACYTVFYLEFEVIHDVIKPQTSNAEGMTESKPQISFSVERFIWVEKLIQVLMEEIVAFIRPLK